MKRYGQLFDDFASFANLLSAYNKARKGAAGKSSTQQFSFQLEYALLELQQELISGSYQPDAYRYFKIYDPKERTISVASFKDRVVHHALINMLEPVYERCFIYDSYATRKGKGTHLAINRAQTFLKRYPWFLKTDIDKYFDSINQEILITLLNRKIKDQRLLEVTKSIIQNGGVNGVGLPIGNLTSQFFANVYLHPFDHFVKQQLGIKYVRYMDDFVLFSKNKEELKRHKKTIRSYLAEQLKLRLKEKATFLNQAPNGLTFLGRRVFSGVIRIARPNGKRMLRRMKRKEQAYQEGDLSQAAFMQSMNSYWAQLEPFYGLRQGILKGQSA